MQTLIKPLLFAIRSFLFAMILCGSDAPNFGIALLLGAIVAFGFELIMTAGRPRFVSLAQRWSAKQGRQGIEMVILMALVPASLAMSVLLKSVFLLAPGYFPRGTDWFHAWANGTLLLFLSAALLAWASFPFIIFDVTRLWKCTEKKP
jgi:hypothetical protein